ncbi:hypothetical protein CLI70_05530 [Prevotella intermedia]|nr:hypothetical protein CLI70_05530 [Prevotella intermedia]
MKNVAVCCTSIWNVQGLATLTRMPGQSCIKEILYWKCTNRMIEEFCGGFAIGADKTFLFSFLQERIKVSK